MNYTAIILAGGKSSRMGEDKGLVLLNGKPMVEYLLDLFRLLCVDVIIVSNNPVYKQFNVPVFEDVIKDKGPLAGIYTGLLQVETEKNIIVSCDIPCMSSHLIEMLLSSSVDHLISVLSYQNKIHPLIGIYSKSLTEDLLNEIQNNSLRVADFVKKHQSNIVKLEEEKFEKELYNINTKEELKMIEHGK